MVTVEVGFDLTVAKYKRSAKNEQINRFIVGVFYTKSLLVFIVCVFYTKTLLVLESEYKSLSPGSGAVTKYVSLWALR